VKRDLSELFYVLASGTGQLAVTGAESNRESLLDEAMRFNELSQQISAPNTPAQAILLQRDRLARAAGKMAVISMPAMLESSTEDPREQRMLAFEAAQQQDAATAARLLENILPSYPQDPTTWFSLGNCYLDLQQFADAEGCFDAAIALHADFTLAYEHRGLARLKLQRFQEARKDFDHVLTRHPTQIPALVNRALVLVELGEIEDAIQDLTTALASEHCPTRVHFLRSQLRGRCGDLRGAAEDRAVGLGLTPQDELSWIARGLARMNPDGEAALSDFREALKLNPKSQPARQNMAHVLSEALDRTSEAIDVLSELLALNPTDSDALVSRGVLYARLGQVEKAKADADVAMRQGDRALHVYQAACIYALTSRNHPADAEIAIQLVTRALQKDLMLSQVAIADSDLDAIRTRPEFQTLLDAAAKFQLTQ
jgi:tetratricopeptide (TPR) repeat protein